jgi:hypothetical protein
MKKLVSYISVFFVMAIMSISLKSFAQFNNEWIDFNKTYYKFKVGETGLYRIPFSTLQANGLSDVPANQFQLWRNGKEVSLFTSVSAGLLGSNDFIEFYGLMNDGKTDAPLYKKPEFQLADKWSLQTDTAAYFLTVNQSANARLVNTPNVIAGNSLVAEPYFMYTLAKNYKDQINPGYAAVVGLYVYSSSYDNGEGWTSRSIAPNSPIVDQYADLFVANAPLDASLKVTAFGNALNLRSLQVLVNGSKLIDQKMDYFSAAIKEVSFASTLIGKGIDTIRINNQTTTGSDRIVVGKYELTYPRQFNFGGASLFEFNLPGSSVGNYLEITNFNNNAVAPILYDLSEGKRYVADMSVIGKFRFVLPPGGKRSFVLMNASAPNIKTITTVTKKVFIDFSKTANQGNYLMISHPSLAASSKGNAIDNYIAYRSSVVGGGYQPKVYDIDELVDQFGLGIKKHPSSVKNFINFARQFFSTTPQNVLLIGRGLTYDQYRYNESRPITEKINIIRLSF